MDNLQFDNNVLNCRVKEMVAIVTIKASAFETFSDIKESETILQFFDEVEKEKEIKALLMVNEQGSFGETLYKRFISEIGGQELSKDVFRNPEIKKLRARARNILNRSIMRATEFDKLFVMGLRGCVVTPFFGLSLSSDFRFATDDMRYSLLNVRLGIPPSGALPFFLYKYLSQTIGTEILIKGEDIPAFKAVEMGLVNKILPNEQFEQKCFEETKKLCQADLNVITSSKRLLHNYKEELLDYFLMESRLMNID